MQYGFVLKSFEIISLEKVCFETSLRSLPLTTKVYRKITNNITSISKTIKNRNYSYFRYNLVLY